MLRDHFPLYDDERHGLWYITRYDDVVNAFRDNVHYSSKNLERSMALVFGTTMMQFDGEEHTKRRNIVAPEFSGRRLEPILPIIEKNTQDLVDRISAEAAEGLAQGFAEKGEVELIDVGLRHSLGGFATTFVVARERLDSRQVDGLFHVSQEERGNEGLTLLFGFVEDDVVARDLGIVNVELETDPIRVEKGHDMHLGGCLRSRKERLAKRNGLAFVLHS